MFLFISWWFRKLLERHEACDSSIRLKVSRLFLFRWIILFMMTSLHYVVNGLTQFYASEVLSRCRVILDFFRAAIVDGKIDSR